MPSGAKKRKAAKRKKEEEKKGKEKEEEKDKERGSIPDPPVSPTNDHLPPTPPPPQPQGNGHEDRMPDDDGRQSESGEFETPSETPFATPLSEANQSLAEEVWEEIPGFQRVAVRSAVESSEYGNGEADVMAYRTDERADDDATELQVEMVAAAADEVVDAPPCDLSVEIVRSEKGEPREAEGAEGTEMEKPAEESVIAVEQSELTREEAKQGKEAPADILKEALAVISHKFELKVLPLPAEDEMKEQPSFERDVKVVTLPGEDEVREEPLYEREVKVAPLPDEDNVKNPQPDENAVKKRSSHEHDANAVPLPDKDEVKEWPYDQREGKVAALRDEDKVKEQRSHEREVKVVPLSDEDVTGEWFCVSGEASQGTRRAEVAPRAPVVVHRARWWNCCGLLDVLVGSER